MTAPTAVLGDPLSNRPGVTLTASMLDQLTTTARQLKDDDLLALRERYTRDIGW